MKKKLASIFAVVVGCLALCIGCGDSAKQELTLVSGEEAKFVIVGDAEKSYVSAIAAKVNTLSGVTPEIIKELQEGQTQIIVGNPEKYCDQQVVQEVPYFGYDISIMEGNLYILAYQEDVLIEAVTAFLGEMENWNHNGKIKIPSDYQVRVELSETFPVAEVPYIEGSNRASVHDYDDGHQAVVAEGVDKSEFEAYCEKVVSEGYKLHSENEINGNLFKTYHNENGIMLHTYWTEFFEEIRTIVAKTELLPIQNTTETANVTTALLHQMKGTEEEGYILRLHDGRFIVFDGGNPTEENADQIYNFLKENAPDKNNIVIATWYISHAHTDHGGGFVAFGKKYGNDSSIKLESIMFNPCDTAEQMKHCTSYKTEIVLAKESYYKDVPLYKPMTGQVYTFGKTSIEILYTMSDFMPKAIEYESDGKGGDYNVQSMVCIVDIDNTADNKDRWFAMHDTTTVACNEMSYRYGSYMKCDFVQVSHHGLTELPTGANCRRHCATIEIYELINPDIALWPTNAEKVAERSELEVNEYLLSIVDEVVIAGNGGRTFEFK